LRNFSDDRFLARPSPSYYAKTNAQQINAQQKAYAEALLEQNRVMKERIDALQKNESTIQSLQGEVERLKKELDSRKESRPAEENKENPSNDFSFWRAAPERGGDDISDLGEIVLFPRSLVSQMRLNDDLAEALEALEQRKILNLLWSLFPSRAYLALITHNAP
jgi:TolA-binding protein